MKSDIITINNQKKGFSDAVEETRKVAAYAGLTDQESLHLQLLTEEMLSLAHSVTGEMEASFWLECEGKSFDLHMTTETVMDREKREQLLSAASSRKNEAARGLLGKLRDAFETAMLSDSGSTGEDLPEEIIADLANHDIESTEWDGYEKSVLGKLADNVKISIRKGLVEMTVSRTFN